MTGPVGTQRLLAQLEGAGGAVARPWVWIGVLGAGPLVRTLAWEAYIFLSVSAACVRVGGGVLMAGADAIAGARAGVLHRARVRARGARARRGGGE